MDIDDYTDNQDRVSSLPYLISQYRVWKSYVKGPWHGWTTEDAGQLPSWTIFWLLRSFTS